MKLRNANGDFNALIINFIRTLPTFIRTLIINFNRTPPTFIRTCADECGNPIP